MNHRCLPRNTLVCLLLCCSLLGGGCTALLTGTVIKPAVGNLQRQQDVELVCEGAPAYLLMIDSLIESDQANRDLLLLGVQSYAGSIAALEACGTPTERLQTLADKAKTYGRQLLSTVLSSDSALSSETELDRALTALRPNAAGDLFWGTYGWLAWIGQQQGSPAALADLVVVEQLMKRVIELDETVENGGAHLFFGILYGAKPALVGGDPERSRSHFQRALELSDRSLLPIQAAYAQTYARMTFDRALHDALLEEVLAFPLETAPENTLINQIAKRRARALLAEEYFGD
ncbi:MAG: hypothetical protein IH612_02805 [Desulfofustis sp.]|nr:hypothetical protein [Desulfofustis sp.]